jgi:molybdopterin-guanine dinucleotide biosynthesis protein A
VEFLSFMSRSAVRECGVVPCIQGRYEGLCAVYPRRMRGLMANRLSAGDYSMQSMIREGIERAALRMHSVDSSELALFVNWNAPEDLKS